MTDSTGTSGSRDVAPLRNLDFTTPPPVDIQPELRIIPHPIPLANIDPDAVKVIRRLNKFNFEAYLVGGCVRDILMGRQPKDFDLATSASPTEIRRIFRNCRLIGRRFRLAHLHFQNHNIIEVATFRRNPTEKDDISAVHAEQNIFGGAADDSVRRDFTINAMMYDVAQKEILDWVDGMGDIDKKRIRTIGDPNRRLPEDPVRIIRAAKFSVRLGLEIEDSLLESMKTHAPLISECSPARLIEEMLKILRSGCAAKTIELLHHIDALSHILPELSNEIQKNGPAYYATLTLMDEMVHERPNITNSFLICSLLYPACQNAIYCSDDISVALEQSLKPLVAPLPFTKRHMAKVRQIFITQRRLGGGPRTKRARKILDRDFATEAIDLFEMTAVNEEQRAVAALWGEALRSKKNTSQEKQRPKRKVRRRYRRSKPE